MKMKRSTKVRGLKRVGFQMSAPPGCTVCVAGTFNAWNPSELKLEDTEGQGVYRTTLTLPPGRHEYKFVVNGEWYSDPCCDEVAANEFGSCNSVIQVR